MFWNFNLNLNSQNVLYLGTEVVLFKFECLYTIADHTKFLYIVREIWLLATTKSRLDHKNAKPHSAIKSETGQELLNVLLAKKKNVDS
jgi:hypothetical protein